MSLFRSRVQNALALILVTVVPAVTAAAQEGHLVPLAELHRDAAATTQARQENLARVEKFFSSESVQASLRTAHLDGTQVTKALPLLSDEELARLTAQTDKLQSDFAAGALTNQQLTYIIIALATAVIVILIVAR